MRYSVLTFIFNNYECVREIQVCDPEAEYILVTDNEGITSDTWQIVVDDRLRSFSTFDKCLYVRYHPFEYVHSDICVRIDGSILIKHSLSPIIDEFERRNADMSIMVNPVFIHLYEDYQYWIDNRQYPASCADKCLAKINELGYQASEKGYYQICYCIERKNSIIKELDEKTYGLLVDLGEDGIIERFDQPIWSFILNKYFAGRIKVMPVDEHLITFSKYFEWCWHNTTEAILFKVIMKPPYLFGKHTGVVYFDYLHCRGHFKKKVLFLRRLYSHKKVVISSFLKNISSDITCFYHSILLSDAYPF